MKNNAKVRQTGYIVVVDRSLIFLYVAPALLCPGPDGNGWQNHVHAKDRSYVTMSFDIAVLYCCIVLYRTDEDGGLLRLRLRCCCPPNFPFKD